MSSAMEHWRGQCRRPTRGEPTCTVLSTTAAALVLSGGLALAQSSGGSSAGAGSASGGAAVGSSTASGIPGASPRGPANPGPNNPNATATPGAITPAPSDSATTGRAPGVNPANPQDLTRRGNPQDMTLPGARNPQDMRDTNTPIIMAPEPRQR